MLFKTVHLQGIRSGKVNLAFRKWQKPSVKMGTLLHTSIGLVEIKSIEVVREIDINNEDALNAGYKSKDELLKSLPNKTPGEIFKIAVNFYSEDPRINLREQTELSEQELADLINKLDRLDRYSKEGAWTRKILQTIKSNPALHAIGIAKLTGFQKEWLKPNIRKLKNLGLTISHTVGYELSPKGQVVLKKISKVK